MPTLHIRKRMTGDGPRYDVKYRRGGRYTPVEHGGAFRTQREARIRLALIADMLAAGQNPKHQLRIITSQGKLFRDVHAEWMASKRVAESTKTNYRMRSKALLDGLGDMNVEEISFRDVIAWITDFSAAHKPATVKLHVGDMRQVLDFAGLEHNPARDRRVELARIVSNEVRPPSAAEVLEMLEGVKPQFRLPLITLEQVGGRITETLRLKPHDIDATGKIRFARENVKLQARGRIVEAPDFLIQPLLHRLPFKGIDRQKVLDAMRPYGYSPHDLRHRRASLWHQQGIVAVELAARLGNTPTVALGTYSHVMPVDEIPAATLASYL